MLQIPGWVPGTDVMQEVFVILAKGVTPFCGGQSSIVSVRIIRKGGHLYEGARGRAKRDRTDAHNPKKSPFITQSRKSGSYTKDPVYDPAHLSDRKCCPGHPAGDRYRGMPYRYRCYQQQSGVDRSRSEAAQFHGKAYPDGNKEVLPEEQAIPEDPLPPSEVPDEEAEDIYPTSERKENEPLADGWSCCRL